MPDRTILIADDEPDSADVLGLLLESYFPESTLCVAYGGQAALAQAASQRPDAAVLDLEMPGVDGEALALALRAPFADHPPLLIALSGNLLRLSKIAGNGAFDHHLSKPADVAVLVRLLQERFSSNGSPP